MSGVHLDTSALIALLEPSPKLIQHLRQRATHGPLPSVSAIVWHEFVPGPIPADELLRVERIVGSRVLPVGRSVAEVGARLFNATGRCRATTADCLIAGQAIEENAELITANPENFEPFVPLGLNLHLL